MSCDICGNVTPVAVCDECGLKLCNSCRNFCEDCGGVFCDDCALYIFSSERSTHVYVCEGCAARMEGRDLGVVEAELYL